MDVYKTIKNIRSVCNNYMDPDLVATIIDENYYMGSNTIDEMQGIPHHLIDFLEPDQAFSVAEDFCRRI